MGIICKAPLDGFFSYNESVISTSRMNYISLPYLDVAVTLKASLLVALRNAGF